jgi:hypothetical protein
MYQNYLDDIRNSIQEADLVVVGLGEEWNISPEMQKSEIFARVQTDLAAHLEYRWLLPYFYYKLTDDMLKAAYQKLFQMLDGKNYYVVSTTVNRSFVSFVHNDRFVMPCGSEEFMCDDALSTSEGYSEFIQSLDAYLNGEISFDEIKFVKGEAGQVITFNNIYAPGYKEEGYLPKWSTYMSWLQGTMNRKTCLLELGAGLQFPSVFRFPFEKMAYFNRKATCFRVHKSLYQLTEEMAERSKSVPVHAVQLFAGVE